MPIQDQNCCHGPDACVKRSDVDLWRPSNSSRPPRRPPAQAHARSWRDVERLRGVIFSATGCVRTEMRPMGSTTLSMMDVPRPSRLCVKLVQRRHSMVGENTPMVHGNTCVHTRVCRRRARYHDGSGRRVSPAGAAVSLHLSLQLLIDLGGDRHAFGRLACCLRLPPLGVQHVGGLQPGL
jgi:hypothetical protein